MKLKILSKYPSNLDYSSSSHFNIDALDFKLFNKLRRKKWKWKFLIYGSWSQSPAHYGSEKFYLGKSSDDKYYALMRSGWGREIAAICENTGIAKEIIAGELMSYLYLNDGPYVSEYYEIADIDKDLFFKHYDTNALWEKRWNSK